MQAMQEITFEAFRLDLINECLWHDARAISLRPKAFRVLKLLVEHPGQLVTKQQALDAVWPETFVGDAVLKDIVRQLREALNDCATSPCYIETAHRRGYRFIARISPGCAVPRIERTALPVREDETKTSPRTAPSVVSRWSGFLGAATALVLMHIRKPS